MATREEAIEIKRKSSAFLLGLPGVEGLGVAEDESGSYCLILQVEEDDPELLQEIPKSIEGCSVKIERSGRYRKL
jgi:hypothetical protein